MKTKKIIHYILMGLPLVVTLVAIQFLPDQVPAHYGADGVVDRWGSKYETLILPIFTILFGFFMLGATKFAAKAEKDGKNNETACMTAGILSLLLFNAMTAYFLITAFQQVENLEAMSLDLVQITFLLLGVFMILTGNIMPKARMNAVFGLRTSWSMKNETTWKKSQRFGGISFILCGAITIVMSLLIKGTLCGIVNLILLLLCTLIDTIYTWYAAKKYA